jgi:hypothetical protein
MATGQRNNPDTSPSHRPFTRDTRHDDSLEVDSARLGDPVSLEIDPIPNPFSSDMEDYALAPEHVAKLEANLSIPAGQYCWDTLNGKLTLQVRKRYIASDTEPHDCSHEGRLIYNVSGICKPVQEGRSGRFMFDISPDLRYRYDKEGARIQPLTSDFLNDNWAKFTKLFFVKYERNPEGTREVLTMVEQGKYFMYITRSNNGTNFLGSLKGM